ncbi:hypothetical protein L1987_19749 [Smallanthus sonchifolius]|uniref:Uncharacterized protein n=1 Tax=Smallanthus sonchifolius TaxID=185202 RepID=A0ACB9IQB9_9ASTR|nr:hypothetical protein L1987_19749 [Smallanthus sonchifolius]
MYCLCIISYLNYTGVVPYFKMKFYSMTANGQSARLFYSGGVICTTERKFYSGTKFVVFTTECELESAKCVTTESMFLLRRVCLAADSVLFVLWTTFVLRIKCAVPFDSFLCFSAKPILTPDYSSSPE